MNEPVYKHLKICTISVWSKNPIPMEKFLQFLTIKTKLSCKNLGRSYGWRERYNEAEKLIITGGVMRGVEYLDAIEFGEKLQNPYNNYVNPFYLFPLMTSEGKAFFKEHYRDEIKNLIEREMAIVKELEKIQEGQQ